MRSRVAAIPLLAAIWMATPVAAGQDPEPRTDPVENRRTAVSRERPPRQDGARAAPTAAAPQDRRPSGAPSAAPEPGPRQESRSSDDDQRGGYTRGRVINPRGPSGSGAPPRGVALRPPAPRAWNAYSYRRPYFLPAYYHNWARTTYRWSPLVYAPWTLIYGSVGLAGFGFSYGGYGPGYYANFGYGPGYYGYAYPPYGAYAPGAPPAYASSYDTGGLRLRIHPRDAQVFVNGYYAGVVDDFDGSFQELRLDAGGHQIEIRMPGFAPLRLDVHIQPGRTITLREDLRPNP